MSALLEVDLPAPDARLQSERGEVALSSLWSDRPVVLVFLRHYG